MRKWNYDFDVPAGKKVRMIVYADAKNEADDQFAIAHHLMTPKFIVRGLIAGHFDMNPRGYGKGHTALASKAEIEKVLDLMGLSGEYPIYTGAETPLADEKTPILSEAAEFIIEEAMREDPLPLYIACQGAITDLASAILAKPEICSRMTAIWIGGGIYPEGGMEFNLANDPVAANVLFRSEMPVWQVPKNTYKQMAVSLAELQYNVKPHGRIGAYLVKQMIDFNDQAAEYMPWPHGEIWGLGDSPTIGLLLMEQERSDVYDMIPAPEIEYGTLKYIHTGKNRPIRVYKDANARLTLADFYAKLALNYPEADS